MDIKGFIYELARRPDSEELRELGRRLLIEAHLSGDAQLALGFLVKDWTDMFQARNTAETVDGKVDGVVASSPHLGTGTVQ